MDGKAVKKTKANRSDTTEGPSERQKNQWLGLARLAICVAREGWQGLCKGGTRTAAAVRGGAWVTVWPLATGHVCCREEETAEGGEVCDRKQGAASDCARSGKTKYKWRGQTRCRKKALRILCRGHD